MDFWNWDWTPMRWDFSFSLPALVTIWIAWLTLKVLQSTKKIQKKQIELIENQNTLIEKQTIASTSLATLAKEKRDIDAYHIKRQMLKDVFKMARCIANTQKRATCPESEEFVSINLPLYIDEFPVEHKQMIEKIRNTYSKYIIEKNEMESGNNVIESGKKIEEMAAEIRKLYPDMFDVFFA